MFQVLQKKLFHHIQSLIIELEICKATKNGLNALSSASSFAMPYSNLEVQKLYTARFSVCDYDSAFKPLMTTPIKFPGSDFQLKASPMIHDTLLASYLNHPTLASCLLRLPNPSLETQPANACPTESSNRLLRHERPQGTFGVSRIYRQHLAPMRKTPQSREDRFARAAYHVEFEEIHKLSEEPAPGMREERAHAALDHDLEVLHDGMQEPGKFCTG